MDFPDAEELEWLESNSFDERFEEDFEIQFDSPSPPSSPEPQQDSNPPPGRPTLSLPPRPSPFRTHKHIKGDEKKRSRLSLPDSPLCVNGLDRDAKRSKPGCDEVVHSVDDGEREGDDEQWIRYSPPQVEEVEVLEEERGERILSRYATEIEGDCIPVTGLDGERVYAKLCTEMGMEEKSNKLSFRVQRDGGLLQEPIRVLMQRVELDEFTNAMRASVEVSKDVITSKEPTANEKLWVDKYAPNSFTELLSAEQTNREVLLWLKQWDSCVFGSEITSTSDDVFSALRHHSSGSRHRKQSTKNYHENKREPRLKRDIMRSYNEPSKEDNFSPRTNEIQDKRQKGYGPPEQKILLLCGPPGLGKTTLAHVAASHCGYRVVEINASDDRSSAAIEAKILDVVQMNSVIADSKPKCLIIDEIDGALNDGKGAVEVILNLVSAEQKRDNGNENVVKKGHSIQKSSQKKKRSTSLLRPVICICNDLYAPAVRPLRQVAKVHIFVQPTVTRVVNRLKYICNKEGVKTSSVALTGLADYTECDIRSCLNTLQFLNQKKEILNVLNYLVKAMPNSYYSFFPFKSEIGTQVVGRKDVSKSAFDVWKEIFHKKKEKRSHKSNYSGNNISKDFDFLYSLISNRGDHELILDGIHENILLLRFIDPVMRKTVKCLDNLLVSDVNHRYIMRTQQMSLQVYQPPIAISIHSLVAQFEKLEIQWPKSFQRHRTISAERMDMFYTWHNRISPHISRHLSITSFVEDSVSLILHILSPPTLRPVALHLLSEKERCDLDQLVNLMVSYFITYKNLKSDRSGTSRHEDAFEASELFRDPPLSKFINFKVSVLLNADMPFTNMTFRYLNLLLFIVRI
ncbi:chromosome transmission fidelity protein 18 [Dorcoceras hygrometricum]|uniref:Chromosome transmission fidelity protein 18 n=1 Tax=Dorcoceras hygrometricum TaxID=472368 RepID=A0A2Z7B6Q2_9LAMI|nr:chromosome transmission fidelity protein 18 [Dorcoceras hygrometricum]